MPTLYERIEALHTDVEVLMAEEEDRCHGAHSELYYDLANAEQWLHIALDRLRKRGEV